MNDSVGDRIRVRRAQRAWTQDHLSDVSGVSARTIRRIESSEVTPTSGTLASLAAAFDVTPGELVAGFTSETLDSFAGEYLCPSCDAPLSQRVSVPHEYGDDELETFACGHMRGHQSRPCPKSSDFPEFENYHLKFWSEKERVFCRAVGTTKSARQVMLNLGAGDTKAEAEAWVRHSYIAERYGYEKAWEYTNSRRIDMVAEPGNCAD